jgi:hypothetical protein
MLIKITLTFCLLLLASCAHTSSTTAVQNKDSCLAVPKAVDQAAKIRSLTVKHYPKCKLLSKQEFREVARKLISLEVKDERLAAEEVVFKILKLIDGKYRYQECLIDGYITEAAAFYSPRYDTIYLPDWHPTPPAILVHEATHVLQQQHFALKKLTKSETLFSDRYLAQGAAIEGDAIITEEEYLSNFKPAPEELNTNNRLDNISPDCLIPEKLKNLFLFQYDYGALFFDRLKSHNKINSRDEVLKNLPSTTREIIHIADYLQGNSSKQLKSKSKLTPYDSIGTKIYTESLGEYIIRQILNTAHSGRISAQTAAGIRGDLLELFKEDSKYQLRWHLEWDTEKDAVEFSEKFKALIGNGQEILIANQLYKTRLDNLKVKGKEVLVIIEAS